MLHFPALVLAGAMLTSAAPAVHESYQNPVLFADYSETAAIRLLRDELAREAVVPLLLSALEEQGVFFSNPVDLDMMMLAAFPQAYEVEDTASSEETDADEEMAGM